MDPTGDQGSQPGGEGRKRAVLIAVAVLAVAMLIGAAIWVFAGRGSADDQDTAEKPQIEHALPTSPDDDSTEETLPSEATATPSPQAGGTSGGTQPAAAGGGGSAFHRNPLVAFRFGGALYVSGEDGSGATKVAPSGSGVFALSPDGRSLAYVDLGTRELVMVEVATGVTATAGGAEQAVPVWSPGSDWVLFTRSATGSSAASSTYRTDVVRAQRSGGAPAVVASGRFAAIAPDARTVVIADDDGGEPAGTFSLEVLRDGRSVKRVRVPGPVTGLATDGTRAYVAVSHVGDTSRGQDGVWTVPLDGGPQARLVTVAAAERPLETRSLLLSPDGSRLAYASTGDDGYSRAAVVSTTGGVPSELARRRDAYPLGWSADGSTVYFIEGNAWQGESTALVRAKPDGSGHTVIVQGAGL